MSKAILVTGATGKQGGSVITALLANPATSSSTILAVTRNASSNSAQKLVEKSPSTIKIVEGDLNDVPALFSKAQEVLGVGRKIWGVYSVQVSQGKGVTHEGEIAQGKALVDAALAHGVSHFVYSSVDRGGDDLSWDVETPIPHFQSKYHLERYLRDQAGEKMGWTILRPVAFMDNWEPGFPARVFLAALSNNLGQQKPLQWVATSDIGVFAAKAFAEPEKFNHRAMGLAGDELSVPQVSATFNKAVNYDLQPAVWVFGSILTTLVSEVRLMVGWFGTDGYGVDVRKCKETHPGMKDMQTWLQTESKFKK